MLALTRRVGQAVRIGDGVRLTVRGRVRDHVLIDLTAPSGSGLTCDGTPLRAIPARRGERYVCSVLAGERLRLGNVRIVFRSPRAGRGNGRQVRLCIEAPRECRIDRDECRTVSPDCACAGPTGLTARSDRTA